MTIVSDASLGSQEMGNTQDGQMQEMQQSDLPWENKLKLVLYEIFLLHYFYAEVERDTIAPIKRLPLWEVK